MPQALILLAVLLWLAGYLIVCRIWPFAACRKCHGDGKLRSPGGRTFRPCPRCKATGRRLRLLVKLLTKSSRTYRDAARWE